MSTQYGLQMHSPFDIKSLSQVIISLQVNEQRTVERKSVPGILVIRVPQGAQLTYTEELNHSGVFHTYIILEGPLAEVSMISKISATADNVLDIIHTVTHATSQTKSLIDCRGILYDNSHILYQSDILAERATQSVAGRQVAQFLEVGISSKVSAIPKLSVFTSQIECSHSLSISNIDSDKIQYLQTRGYSEESAKNQIIESFLL